MGGGGVAGGESLPEIQILKLHPDLLNQNLQGEDLGIPVCNKHPGWFLPTSKFGKHWNLMFHPTWQFQQIHEPLGPGGSQSTQAARDKEVLSHTEATSVRESTLQDETNGGFAIKELQKELWIKQTTKCLNQTAPSHE